MNKRTVKICREIARNKKGNILLITVLILSGMLAVGLGISTIVLQGIMMNRNQEFSTTAYFAAEAGAERVIYSNWTDSALIDFEDPSKSCDSNDYISFNDADCGGTNPCCVPTLVLTDLDADVNGKKFSIRYIDNGNGTSTLKCVGTYRGVKRSIDITY